MAPAAGRVYDPALREAWPWGDGVRGVGSGGVQRGWALSQAAGCWASAECEGGMHKVECEEKKLEAGLVVQAGWRDRLARAGCA